MQVAPGMPHVMLDLETMDVAPTAAIVAIGVVEFDPILHVIGRSLYLPVDLASATHMGGTISADTVLWWLHQEQAARNELSRADRHNLAIALADLARWLQPCGAAVRMWGNAHSFDCSILRGAYLRAGMNVPWRYSSDRCYRTLKGLMPHIKPIDRAGTHHHALDDAMHQARHALQLLAAVQQQGSSRTAADLEGIAA